MGYFLRTRNTLFAVTLTLLVPITSKATLYNLGAFWKQPSAGSGDSLAFTSSAFSGLTTWTCVGPVTVQSQTGGAPKTVSSNTTVNLTGISGMHFFSDSGCTQEVTSATIPSGSSSASFYFLSGKKSSLATLSAAASNYTTATQNQTVTAYLGCTWLGGTAGNATTWETSTNWSCGHMPTSAAGDIAVFDANCGSNCTPTVPASSQDLYGLYLTRDYTGTVQQGANALIVEVDGGFRIDGGTFVQSTQNIVDKGVFTQTGGTFQGGSGSISLTGDVSVSGGSLTLTSGLTFVNGTWSVTGSATLNANGGNLYLQPNSIADIAINPGAVHYNNVSVYPSQTIAIDFGGATFYVDGDLAFGNISNVVLVMSKTKSSSPSVMGGGFGGPMSGGGIQVSSVALNNVTFSVGGNVASTDGGAIGSAQFIFRGASPTLSIDNGSVAFPSGNVIVSVSGTLGLLGNTYLDANLQSVTVTSGAINMNNHDFTIGKALTLSPGTSVTRGTGTLTVSGATLGAGAYSGGTIY
ncbi:MAG: hypothetical protein ACJ763_06335 [Bdellovibrionia bacterium]